MDGNVSVLVGPAQLRSPTGSATTTLDRIDHHGNRMPAHLITIGAHAGEGRDGGSHELEIIEAGPSAPPSPSRSALLRPKTGSPSAPKTGSPFALHDRLEIVEIGASDAIEGPISLISS